MANPETIPKREMWPRYLIAVTLVLLSALAWYKYQKAWTASKIDAMVRPALPPGSSRADVEAWFDEHAIRHSYSQDLTGDRLGQRTMSELAGLNPQELSGMVKGEVPPNRHGWW